MYRSLYEIGGAAAIVALVAGSAGGAVSVNTTVPIAASVVISLPADASVDVSTDSCDNSPGPFITLSGEIALSDINARVIFRNNVQGTHTHTEDVVVDVVILPAGETIRFAKQPPLGGVGGNPLIFMQFLDGSGNALGDALFLGRCVQLN